MAARRHCIVRLYVHTCMDTVTVPSRALVRPLYGRTNGSWDMHPGPNPLSSHDVLVVMPSRRFIQQRLLCALTLHRVTACCARSGSLFRSAWHMRSPSVASHRGAMLFPVGAFQQHLGCALACAPTLCCVASRHRLVPSRRTFQQCLAYVLAIPCAVLRHPSMTPTSTNMVVTVAPDCESRSSIVIPQASCLTYACALVHRAHKHARLCPPATAAASGTCLPTDMAASVPL